ncbi:MAG: hypothetical protein DMF63_11855 [Acidobacteria bacterium]|nr:MAG: hypothetical protein DMF63_11855 [Acidobacteriota bacterium]
MKKLSINLTLVLSLLLFGFTVSDAQLADEIRPFDFSNDFYKSNGIIAGTLIDRRNGEDKKSVFDTPTDPVTYTNVRILETMPGYSADGSAIYWNLYAFATLDSFITNAAGYRAYEIAKTYPVYVFPSSFVRDSYRQSALIATDSSYFQNNPLGIGVLVNVEFNPRISRSGQKTLNILAQRNGTSAEGTPIIRTLTELRSLADEGLVIMQTDDRTPVVVAKIIQFPERGGITPDAYLTYVTQPDGKPLAAEEHFVTKFECLQDGSRLCL